MFRKIPVAVPAFIGNEKKYLMDCIDSTWVSSLGRYIDLFEVQFAEYIGRKYAVTCSNGTTALHLALLVLGIQKGDEVICPTFTYVASANSIMYVGASPVFVDCDPETFNIDPQKIESAITPKTKAILVVPLYGHPCEYEKILKIARAHGLQVIEDAAEGLGAIYNEKKCGMFGDISTFSLYGNKVITSGEGGMILVDDFDMYTKIRLFRDQGMSTEKRYWFDVVGYNYRMTNMQAAIGLAQLETIEEFLEKRQQLASWYDQELSPISQITTPRTAKHARHAYWMYSILVDNMEDRQPLMDMLSVNGIETRPFFYPMHVLPIYSEEADGDFRVADDISGRGINLPTHYLLSKQDVAYIAKIIKSFYASK